MSEKISKQEAERSYPGASIDTADDDRTTKREIKQRTKTLDDNPRDHDLKMP